MDHHKKNKKKVWVTPEINVISGFNVHESVVAISVTPWGTQGDSQGEDHQQGGVG